nr:MAG: RNA-dependent RNA polymerase [Porcine picobirnavirus]
MFKSNESKFGNYFKLPNPGLRSYFNRVVAGQPDEYRTPFGKGKSVQKILSEWAPNIQTLATEWPTLVDFENDLKAKVGPLSIMKPLRDRMKDIDNYYDLIKGKSEPVKLSAIAAVLKEFEVIRGFEMKTEEQTVFEMKKSTSSGSPFFIKRKSCLEDTIPCDVCQTGNTVIQKLQVYHSEKAKLTSTYPTRTSKYTFLACAVLGWRGQEGGPKRGDVKQRVVWMFPFAVNIQELRMYNPLIELCQAHNLVPAWVSMEAVDERITKMFDSKAPQDLVVCTDFSKFDQHFNSNLQNCARDILYGLATKNLDTAKWFQFVYPIKYMIPLAYDWNKIRFGAHGMASGSGGTNADETLTHRALQYEAAQSQGKLLNVYSQCLGDDGILTYPGITVEDVMRSYTKHGLEMNETKQYASTQDCVYLRRWHHKDYRRDGICVGVYSTFRAIGRLCEQERYYDPEVWGRENVALRQLSIIENCKNHPLFEEFVKFCMKQDKYRLGLDIPGFLDNIAKVAKKAIDLMPDFLGYTKSVQKNAPTGIENWEVVKLLKRFRHRNMKEINR